MEFSRYNKESLKGDKILQSVWANHYGISLTSLNYYIKTEQLEVVQFQNKTLIYNNDNNKNLMELWKQKQK